MKVATLVFKILFATFLVICVSVHIYGLFVHITNEGTASHLIHITGYSLCLLAFLAPVPNRAVVYILAAVYPWLFHAHCAWVSLIDLGKWNQICWLVVAMMPIGALWILSQSPEKSANQ